MTGAGPQRRADAFLTVLRILGHPLSNDLVMPVAHHRSHPKSITHQ